MATSQVKLENKTAHIKVIGIGNGEFISVPPVELPGGITVSFADDVERARFDKAVATVAVKQWTDAGDLIVTPIVQPPVEPPPAEPPPEPPVTRTSRSTR